MRSRGPPKRGQLVFPLVKMALPSVSRLAAARERTNPSGTMATAADLLLDTVIDWGVDTVFGLPGDGINGIMEALRQRQERVRFVQVRHEEAAATQRRVAHARERLTSRSTVFGGITGTRRGHRADIGTGHVALFQKSEHLPLAIDDRNLLEAARKHQLGRALQIEVG
jgi:hypothetical protein